MNAIFESSPELRKQLNEVSVKVEGYKFPWLWWWAVALLFSLPVVLSILLGPSKDEFLSSPVELPIMILSMFLGGAFWSTVIVGGVHRSRKGRLEKIRHDLLVKILDDETVELQGELKEDFFTNLVKINFKYLDKYYLQTQVQADKSFWLSVSAAVTGLTLVTVGVLMMFFGKTEPGYVTAAAGVIGEFISAVFFYLYNQTVSKMADYHQKLVLTQNVSLALKIADDLPDGEKAQAKLNLVEYLSKDVKMYLSGSNNSIQATQ